jgi:hypothetical protein
MYIDGIAVDLATSTGTAAAAMLQCYSPAYIEVIIL